MDSEDNDNNLAIYQSIVHGDKQFHPQEKRLVDGYLRQQQHIYFRNKPLYFNLQCVDLIILLYSAGLITVRIAPAADIDSGIFTEFEWSVYSSCSIEYLLNGIMSRIPAKAQNSYTNRKLSYQQQELRSISHKTVSDSKITHLATLNWTKNKNKAVIKVGMLGDSHIGKTKLMREFIGDKYDEDEPLGVNFMEKTFELKNVNVAVSIWDLGAPGEWATLMPIVCSDAKVIIFAFDLTQKPSLLSVKRWYKEARKENKIFMPFLVGTRYNLFAELQDHYVKDITKQARKFARKMHAPLVYCSTEHSINVKAIFKIIIAKRFDLKPKIREARNELKEPLIEFDFERKDNDIDEDDTDIKYEKGKKKKDKKRKDKDKKKKKKKKNESDSSNNLKED